MEDGSELPPALGSGLTFAMAGAAGIAVANIYYNQPMLGIIGQDFAGSGATALIPTATQLGYAASLFLLLPLGDLLDQKRLIVSQFVVLAAALALAALAPSAPILVLASLVVGMTATVAQQIVPFAAHLAPPARRGATVGIVTGGVLTGI
ncbi:MFS transporter, partial [Roseomonas sp. KE2513]|nr:MFS transporter [Roseomonas sp. KE2513]